MRETLKKLRTIRGDTATDTSNKLGVTTQYYNLIELGKRHGSPKFWQKVKKVYGISNELLWTIINEK